MRVQPPFILSLCGRTQRTLWQNKIGVTDDGCVAICTNRNYIDCNLGELLDSLDEFPVLDAIFDRPIFRSNDFAERLNLNKVTAATLLKQLREAGVLALFKEASGRQPAVLVFPELLNIAEGRPFVLPLG